MVDVSQIQTELLPQCTVRVHLGERHAGTGFYVAPGLIATCDHVIRPALSSAGGETIAVVDRAGVRHEAEFLKGSQGPDLAILRLRAVPDHACALLDANLRPNDEVHTVGYPQERDDRGLVPTTLTAEGPIEGPDPFQKLKGGQVRPGMSGSPVLNNRTGGVCGVLKRTRSSNTDLGGFAIPVTLLDQLDSTLMVENERYHAKNSRWTDALPAETRRLRGVMQHARVAETAVDAQFIVDVGVANDRWQVSATVDEGGDRTNLGPIPVDLNLVRAEATRLFRYWASRKRIRTAGGEVALLGSIFYRAIFPGDIGARFAELRTKGRRIAVALRFEGDVPEELQQLPWEHLYVPGEGGGGGVALAREPRLTFYRSLPNRGPIDVTERQQLSLLLVAVKPRREQDEAAAVVDNIARRIKGLEEQTGGALTVTVLDPPGETELGDEVDGYDIVHYVGGGDFGAEDMLAFFVETAEHGLDYFPASTLRERIVRGSPSLVVLQLCEWPLARVPADFAVVARELVDAVPAVVGCQYPMTAETAIRFNDALYTQLARGSLVDVAVQEARGKLASFGRFSVSPALFLRTPGSFRLTGQRREVTARTTAGAFSG
jgi:Trypsin-like peptidase domain/CHAT domain